MTVSVFSSGPLSLTSFVPHPSSVYPLFLRVLSRCSLLTCFVSGCGCLRGRRGLPARVSPVVGVPRVVGPLSQLYFLSLSFFFFFFCPVPVPTFVAFLLVLGVWDPKKTMPQETTAQHPTFTLKNRRASEWRLARTSVHPQIRENRPMDHRRNPLEGNGGQSQACPFGNPWPRIPRTHSKQSGTTSGGVVGLK